VTGDGPRTFQVDDGSVGMLWSAPGVAALERYLQSVWRRSKNNGFPLPLPLLQMYEALLAASGTSSGMSGGGAGRCVGADALAELLRPSPLVPVAEAAVRIGVEERALRALRRRRGWAVPRRGFLLEVDVAAEVASRQGRS
jgi:hypothetical protein